jgi:sensor domain CHASE-containing protein
MSIQQRLTLWLCAVVAAFCCVLHWVLRSVVLSSFQELELSEAVEDVQRVQLAIQDQIDQLDDVCRDWGVWDETYEFVAGENPGFPAAHFYPGVLASIDLALLVLCDLDGRVLWQDRRAPAGYEGVPLAEFPLDALPTGCAWLRSPQTRGSAKGVLDSSWGPLLVSAQPILQDQHKGEVLGTFFMARAPSMRRASMNCMPRPA